MEILEDEATMPEGWLENESEEIDDLEAWNPKDWMTMRMVSGSMDSEQSFGYRVTGEGSSYSSSHPHIPLRLFESLKFEARNSPNSPFLTHFDSETFTTLSDSQEKYSSTSGASLSLKIAALLTSWDLLHF
ncbi:hypothetical protein L6452_38030 [Arctium lappa]|uniref:Uncharacterized protein n=1 Tax=Arctium lappa TaxID=4217 RepID=A0ACB8Y5E0_ARCLA|nr:hypothetical protein L6452_38030 [Arctium lappa]